MEEFVHDSSDLIRDVFEACARDDKESARLLILREVADSKRISSKDDIEEFFSSIRDEIQGLRTRFDDRGWEAQLGDREDFGLEVPEERHLAQVMHLLFLTDPTAPLAQRMRVNDFEEGIRMIGKILTECERQFRWADAFIGRLQKRMQ